LKRRNVIRVAIAYGVASWFILQLADVVLENIGAPGWMMQTVMLVLAAGFPLAVIVAWAFEMTPEGIKKEKDVDRSRSITSTTGRKLDRMIIGILTVTVAYLLIDKLVLQDSPPAPTETVQSAPIDTETPVDSSPSVAVLPFVNMSGDPAQEYIADGISETLITALSNIPDVFVISRESSFYFKGKPVKIQQVSEELGVRYVLEGSIQQSGNHIRVTAQLIDAFKGHHLWAENFDRELINLFELQDDLTLQILTGMQVKLLHGERDFPGGTRNINAYLKMIKGKYYYYRYTREGNIAAHQLLEEALALDPNYLHALLWLGFVHITDIGWGWSQSPAESLKKAAAIAEKILALDDGYAGGYRLLAFILSFRGQFDRAFTEAQRAIALKPGDAYCYGDYGMILTNAGRPEEAIMAFEKALRLDPYPEGIMLLKLAQAYHKTRRYQEALNTFNRLLGYVEQSKFVPLPVHFGMTLTCLELGRKDEAIKHATNVLEIDPNVKFTMPARANYGYKDLYYLKNLLSPLNSLLYTEGTGKNIYAYEGIPSFYFEYPAGGKKIEPTSPKQVLRMTMPEGFELTADIEENPAGMKLADIAPKIIEPALLKRGTKIELISNKEITLKDGTQAYRFEFKWLYADGRIWFNTMGVGAFQNNKCVILAVHPMEGHPTDVAWIVESLLFEMK
jgi:TolB-like protein